MPAYVLPVVRPSRSRQVQYSGKSNSEVYQATKWRSPSDNLGRGFLVPKKNLIRFKRIPRIHFSENGTVQRTVEPIVLVKKSSRHKKVRPQNEWIGKRAFKLLVNATIAALDSGVLNHKYTHGFALFCRGRFKTAYEQLRSYLRSSYAHNVCGDM